MLQCWSGDIVIVGMTRGNIEKLTAGQPMVIEAPSHKTARIVVLVFGEDKPAIFEAMEKAGIEVPDTFKRVAMEDPT